MPKKVLNTIGATLRANEKSIYWLAAETGLSYSLLHSYASGKREPGLENIFKIAEAMRVNPKELINS